MDLTIERDGNVAIFTITRGPNNFFDAELLGGIADAATDLTNDANDCRSIVIRSEGKNFCAGADFSKAPKTGDRSASARETYSQAVRIFDIPVPVVASVQGAAVGGGMGLACAADFRIATERTRFHANFAQLGFHPGFALSLRLQELVGKQSARRILLSSQPVRGERALELGLSDELVAEDALLEASLEVAHSFARLAPLAVRSIKSTLMHEFRSAVPSVLEHELTEQSWLWKTDDASAGIAANLRRERPVFTGR